MEIAREDRENQFFIPIPKCLLVQTKVTSDRML